MNAGCKLRRCCGTVSVNEALWSCAIRPHKRHCNDANDGSGAASCTWLVNIDDQLIHLTRWRSRGFFHKTTSVHVDSSIDDLVLFSVGSRLGSINPKPLCGISIITSPRSDVDVFVSAF